ncbi:MAG: hypothetical protein WCV90_00475 [Candidatus Woesearchaeota archaeon]|jgi:hypothetical protein
MAFATLDESVKIALDNLPEESDVLKCYAYVHEILWYGTDSIVHAYLMGKAREIFNGAISREDFMSKYDLNYDDSLLSVGIEGIRRDGVFIPQQKENPRIYLFSRDYNAKLPFTFEYDYARELTSRCWVPSDIEDSGLVTLGLRCGKDMWKNCVEGYESTKDGKDHMNRDMFRPVPSKDRNIIEQLILYYSALISEPPSRE